MAKLKYHGKLKAMRKHVKNINGVPVIGKKWLLAYLSKTEMLKFEKVFEWRKVHKDCICPTCGEKHSDRRTSTRWAYWWDLEKLLVGSES